MDQPLPVIPVCVVPPPLPPALPPHTWLPSQPPRRGLKPLYLGLIIAFAVLLAGGAFAYRVVQAVNKIRAGLPSPTAAQTSPAIEPTVPAFPTRPPVLDSNSDIEVYPMTITGTGPGLPMRVRLYLPAGRHVPHSLPCVLVAPAGTRMLHGASLGDEDSPEHVPYAKAGFAVLAYELSGAVQGDPHASQTYAKLKVPVQQFMDADGGLVNAHTAVDFVLANVPEVDLARLYTAGHSSAATMALNAAAIDHRFCAVAAYAPGCDVSASWGKGLATMNSLVTGAVNLAARVSPMKHVHDIDCPVLVFHADDDTNVLTADNLAYVTDLQNAGKDVDFQKVPTGGHYRSMIRQGIPDGIKFFEAHGANPLPPIVP